MELIQEGILIQVENVYEKEVVTPGQKPEEVYKGFKSEGKVVLSNHPSFKKGDTALVNAYGGSEVSDMNTKKHRFLIIESRDILLKR